MFKAVLASAVAGLASAGFTFKALDVNLQNNDSGFSYYNFQFTFDLDAGFRTLYNPQVSNAPAVDRSESYSMELFSQFIFQFRHELMEAYMGTYDFTFQPLTVTPYGAQAYWTRFDNGEGFNF